jgi:secreted Zn-dependent insulinase-like peptidase
MTELPYAPDFYNKIYKILPVQDLKDLEITWTLSNKKSLYKNPPSEYISHIISHEGKGSLLSFLVEEGLATDLSVSGYNCYNLYSEFTI